MFVSQVNVSRSLLQICVARILCRRKRQLLLWENCTDFQVYETLEELSSDWHNTTWININVFDQLQQNISVCIGVAVAYFYALCFFTEGNTMLR